MDKLKEIEERYKETTEKYREEYKSCLIDLLKEVGLDGDVMELNTGHIGKLDIIPSSFGITSDIVFRKVTKSGELSKSYNKLYCFKLNIKDGFLKNYKAV